MNDDKDSLSQINSEMEMRLINGNLINPNEVD